MLLLEATLEPFATGGGVYPAANQTVRRSGRRGGSRTLAQGVGAGFRVSGAGAGFRDLQATASGLARRSAAGGGGGLHREKGTGVGRRGRRSHPRLRGGRGFRSPAQY